MSDFQIVIFSCIFRENTVKIIGFVNNQEECKDSCANDIDCVYYKYFSAEDAKKSKFCYHLKKCASRAIQRSECPLHKSNYIDHFLFVETITDCRQKCQDNAECKYWYWYRIDYSPAPLYCYLYRSCEGSTDEQVRQYYQLFRHLIIRSFRNSDIKI